MASGIGAWMGAARSDAVADAGVDNDIAPVRNTIAYG
jgi:hypothetical protein